MMSGGQSPVGPGRCRHHHASGGVVAATFIIISVVSGLAQSINEEGATCTPRGPVGEQKKEEETSSSGWADDVVSIPSPPVAPAPEDASSLLQTKTHLHLMAGRTSDGRPDDEK